MSTPDNELAPTADVPVPDRTDVTVVRRGSGLGIGSILLLVALVPLVGIGLITWTSVSDANEAARAGEATETLAARSFALATLDGAVFEEMVWGAINDVASMISVHPAMLEPVVGSNPVDSRRSAIDETDELLATLDLPVVERALQAARSLDGDLYTTVRAYGAVSELVEFSLDSTLTELTATSAGARDGADLARATLVLRHSIELRSSVTEGFFDYFASVFAVRDAPADELARLILARETYETNLQRLDTVSIEVPTLRGKVAQLVDDPVFGAYTSAIDGRIDEALATGVPPQGIELTLGTLIGNFESFDIVFTGAAEASTASYGVVDAAAASVLDIAAGISDDANGDIRRSSAFAVGMTLATVAAALLAARSIVRPLRRLEQAADALHSDDARTSDVAGPATSTGPSEVRAAASALQHAEAHLELVTAQARALAAGDLHADVLEDRAPGGLGAALSDAVGTLRSALARQEDFRRRLAHEAAHDGLTSLPNRTASMKQLTRAIARTERSDSQLAVLFVDLDRFKDVNDHHGHHAGDVVLTAAAQRLLGEVREGDLVGRLGGDEFVIVAEPIDGVDEAIELGHRMLGALAEPVDIGSVRVSIGASIGIAITSEAHLTADELLRDADLAVYRAKELGRGGVQICDEALRSEMLRTADISIALRHAIDADELVVHYQPVLDAKDSRLRALEALVRWRRPGVDGLVPPAEFIDIAERSSLIVDLDRWVIEHVVRQIAEWHADGRFLTTPVAINISGRHIGHRDLPRHVLDPLARHGVAPGAIVVEVTESALVDDLGSVALALQQLRDEGVAISIDDFGTGYTSLAHLRSLPVDVLKVDRSLVAGAVADPNEASIIKLIIDTGHLLGAAVTAEGIETAQEATVLAELGADQLQGYYFSRPQPAAQLPAAHDLSAPTA